MLLSSGIARFRQPSVLRGSNLLWVIAAFLAGCSISAAKTVEADICVYGGTSGGVAAAVQATRMGRGAVIAEPGQHLGGMTAGGLSAVDIGDPRSVGGIAREYFTRLVATYGKKLAWDQAFEGKGGPATGGAYSIEPHVAEQVFNEMAREAKVQVYRGARLASVVKDGARLVEFTTEDGTIFRAKVFIDATYEGDLMAKAGVTYTVQREGNAKYGETYNGIYYDEKYIPRTNHKKPGPNGRVPGGQGVWDRDLPLDPYVVKGDPKSGLLPLLDVGEPGTPGEPAPGVQAYCYRLCLTTAPDRIPIAPPPGYDPKRYELVARFIEGCLALGDDMDLRWFSKHDALPNDKWDFNTATFGGNLPGASWEWPEASYARREEIAKEHENYHRGLLRFLATDPRVPAKVRDEMKRYGLPRDEFKDRGGWPHQIYVREGRRMISDLVLTEHHTFGRAVAPHPIALGSYGTDTHEVRRIVKDGVVIREGKTAGGRGGFGPYQIGYGAIVPKAAECDNLFVTFALSASHTAFSSVRMEPVFMATSQSAATAAALAIKDNVPVQQVDYLKLEPRLLTDGQVLIGQAKTPAIAKPAPPEDGVLLSLAMEPEAGERFQHVDFSCWLPDATKPVRAVIIHQHGCTNASPLQHPPVTGDFHWRALARKHNAALLVPMYQVKGDCADWNDPEGGSERALFAALADFAKRSGCAELKGAPWVLWGHSGGSSWSAQMVVRHPDRVLAASFRGGCHRQFGVPDFRARFSAVARDLPLLFVWGKRESVPASSHYVSWEPMNTMFRELRTQGGTVARVIDPRSEHGCDDSRLLVIPFFDAVLNAKLDGGKLPGALVDTASLETRAIASASLRDPALAWLPNEHLAKLWREFSEKGTLQPAAGPLIAPVLGAAREANGIRLSWRIEPDLAGGLRALRIHRDGALWKEVGVKADAFVATARDAAPVGLRDAGVIDDSNEPHTYTLTFLDAAGHESPSSAPVRVP